MLDTQDAGRFADYPRQLVLQALLAQSLTSFTEFAFGVVRPGIVFKPNWHLEAVTHKLAQVASGGVRRLIITLPPRNLKSLCASVALPAWFLGHNPSERVVVVSYSDFLARSHANDFRLLVNHPVYQAAFPGMRLARDTDREIVTTKRGKRIATSIDGTLTGLGGILIIIDDPLKLGDAMSEAVRMRVIEWYRSTLLSRADDKTTGRIVLVMQRVHQDDLAGYLQEQGGFEVLNLPAIAQREEIFVLGDGRTYTRHRGELLHPEQEPAHVLAELKREMGPIAFSAQYQQSPIPPGGTIIKRKWLRRDSSSSWRPHYPQLGHRTERSGNRRLFGLCCAAAASRSLLHSRGRARPLSLRRAQTQGDGDQKPLWFVHAVDRGFPDQPRPHPEPARAVD
jgi:hypothetical protein